MARIREMVPGVKTTFIPVGEGGRIAIPKEFRKALGLAKGDRIVMELLEDERELRIVSSREALKKFREEVRKLPGASSLVEDLIADRRAENAKDEQETRGFAERLKQPDRG